MCVPPVPRQRSVSTERGAGRRRAFGVLDAVVLHLREGAEQLLHLVRHPQVLRVPIAGAGASHLGGPLARVGAVVGSARAPDPRAPGSAPAPCDTGVARATPADRSAAPAGTEEGGDRGRRAGSALGDDASPSRHAPGD
eukprot:9339071-Pyramimonas_sp.AAC.1